jgi:hypothetical protein
MQIIEITTDHVYAYHDYSLFMFDRKGLEGRASSDVVGFYWPCGKVIAEDKGAVVLLGAHRASVQKVSRQCGYCEMIMTALIELARGGLKDAG